MITDRKETSQRHILAAIAQFHDGNLDCAITLAGAAEGILPETTDPHLSQQLLSEAKPEGIDLNLVRNRLEHVCQPDVVGIDEYEGVFNICRAISKFVAVCHQSCIAFERFMTWQENAG